VGATGESGLGRLPAPRVTIRHVEGGASPGVTTCAKKTAREIHMTPGMGAGIPHFAEEAVDAFRSSRSTCPTGRARGIGRTDWRGGWDHGARRCAAELKHMKRPGEATTAPLPPVPDTIGQTTRINHQHLTLGPGEGRRRFRCVSSASDYCFSAHGASTIGSPGPSHA